MGGFGITHWIIFGVIAILVLGGGRFSNMMGDVAKGIKQFKKGMAEDDDAVPPTRLEAKRADPVIDPVAERVRDTER
jgi:sec-independent protein translocase protein TatA